MEPILGYKADPAQEACAQGLRVAVRRAMALSRRLEDGQGGRPSSRREGGQLEEGQGAPVQQRERGWGAGVVGVGTYGKVGVDVAVDPALVRLGRHMMAQPLQKVAEHRVAHGVRKHNAGASQLAGSLKRDAARRQAAGSTHMCWLWIPKAQTAWDTHSEWAQAEREPERVGMAHRSLWKKRSRSSSMRG